MSVNATSNYLQDYIYYTAGSIMFTTITALRIILLLPLCAFVLYLGHQQWKQQRSFRTASHADIFTYHMAAMELIFVMGVFLSFGGTCTNQSVIAAVGSIASLIPYFGEILFHVLTCVAHYLAVVHPIIYMGLRTPRGVRIRNITIGCVWLLCFGLIGADALLTPNNNYIQELCLLVLSIITLSFCSVSVLCALIRPGPEEGGKQKDQVHQIKQRAFYTIATITCAVWLWFAGHLISIAISMSPLLSINVKYVLLVSTAWFNLPSCLVLPLLYLYKERKLSWVCFNNK